MFRKFKKSKIELSCPHCGHHQLEPSLVVSSFCEECGEHFRVQKGIAVPSPGLRVSGITELESDSEQARPTSSNKPVKTQTKKEKEKADTKSDESWQVDAEESDSGAKPLARATADAEKEEGISAGAFFGLVDEEEVEAEAQKKGIGEQAQSRETLAEGSMGALIANSSTAPAPEKGKMPPNYVPPEKRKKLVDASSEFEVRCFRCYHVQNVSRYAKSTQCERCSVYISLANYEIKAPNRHTIRTRGDVVIGRRGGLKNCEVACHHLTVSGSIDAYVDCSGDAVFRHSGVVKGHLYCRKLLIEKNCVVEFPDGIMTERAEVQGRLVGNITCSGKLRIARSGSVEGDVTAADLELKDGAVVSGETLIDPETSTELPVKMGFNPSVIG